MNAARSVTPHTAPESWWDLPMGAVLSVMLHLAVALLAIFGLPFIVAPPPQVEESVPVDLLPLGAETAAPQPRAEQQKPEEKPPEPAKEEAKPLPPPEPPKAPPPPPPAPPPPPPPVAKEEVPLPAPEKKPEPPKEEPKPAPDQLAEIKPQKKPPPPPDDMQSLLKTLEKMRPQAQQEQPQKADDFKALEKTLQSMQSESAPQPRPQVASSAPGAPNFAAQATASDIDFIRAQIERHWNFDPGARDAATLIVQIRVTLQPDGTVVRADIVPDPRYDTDDFYRSAADTARRAVLAASPLQLPPGKYETFKDITLRFDPRDALR